MQDSLNKLYVEITSACNLDCVMCVRHAWHETTGRMPLALFDSLVDDMRQLPQPPTLQLSGFGEPMAHSDFFEMVRRAKAAGLSVEITTNATLLTREAATQLIDLGLDRLTVSMDGVTAGSYDDIRSRSSFELVLSNLIGMRRLKLRKGRRIGKPYVGIAFVAMKRNVAELAHLPELATRVGANRILVSNLVPHSPEMERDILYARSLTSCTYRASPWVAEMSLPKMDVDARTEGAISQVFNSTASISMLDVGLDGRNDYCRFAHDGYAAVRWDGKVSPCLPLLHDHPVYMHGRRKDVTHYYLGDLSKSTMTEVWNSPEFVAHRSRLRRFPFSACSTCGGCERFAGNFIDCSGNTFPTCGACLWAQGFVQCP